jgi:hypothetical protein
VYRFQVARVGSRKVLVPALPFDEEWFDNVAIGTTVEVCDEDTSPSSKARRFFWALCGKIIDNHPFWNDKEALADYLKIGAGLVSYRVWPDGKVNMFPRSIADGAMRQAEFKEFLDKAIDLVVTRVLPGMPRGQLLKEVRAMCGVDYDRDIKGEK